MQAPNNGPPQQQQQQPQQQAAGQFQPQPQSQPQHSGLRNLVRPDQIPRINFLSDVQKNQYIAAFHTYWQTISTAPPNSQEYNAALSKLTHMSNAIVRQATANKELVQQQQQKMQQQQQQQQQQLRQQQQQQQQQQQASQSLQIPQQATPQQFAPSRPQPPMQPQQLSMQQQPAAQPVVQTGAQQRPQQQQAQQAPRPVSQTPLQKYPQSQTYLQHLQAFQQLPPDVQNRLNSYNLVAPPTETSKEQQETWFMGAKARFGQFLHRYELALKTVTEINRRIEQRRAATNNQIPPQELAELQNKLKQACVSRDEATEYMNKFRRQQETIRTATDNIQKTAVSQAQSTQPLAQQPLQQMQQQAQPQQLQPQMQVHQATTGPSQVPPAGPAAHTIDSAVHAARAGQQQSSSTGSVPASQMTPSMGVPSAAVRPTMNQGTPQSQPQQIGQPARASTSSAAGTPTPGQGLGNGRQASSSDKDKQGNNQQPRALDVKPVLPIQMPPARPTLTGGPGNTGFGVLGQPAVQKHPGYVIESEGQRVLSKKMLDVLVRQVTGGGEAEGLTPDAEEFILQMADDFVDDVVTSACRLAKLRTSSTLDIRDIQLILERNYNMRTSGFSADDLRTVRKPNPTPSWAAKMSAVQAAKLTQGRTE